MMRLLMIPALIVAAMSIGAGGAQAERYWPWCSRYGWSTICAYATFQQCQASVSGAGGYCMQNVMPPPLLAETRVVRTRKHRY
jgi:hypothetical protein